MSSRDLSHPLADIDNQIAKAEKLTVQPNDYETLERASKALKELREQRREVEKGVRSGSESFTKQAARYRFDDFLDKSRQQAHLIGT